MNTHNEFSVYRFFADGKNEAIKRFVGPEEALKTAIFWTKNVFVHAVHGIATRVIVTDGGDCICFEWIFGEGITFPKREDIHGNN